MKTLFLLTGFAVMAGLTGCAGSQDAGSGTIQTVEPTCESLYEEGRRVYHEAAFDSARHYLEASLAIDSTYVPALRLLGEISYQAGLAARRTNGAENAGFRSSLRYYMRVESAGVQDAEVYERLTEITDALGENQLFLDYAEKQALKFPGDRQSYNRGLAYLVQERFQDVIETQKKAIDAYGSSPYIGGFYRLLGDAYFSIDRQQSAERTYSEGVAIIDERISAFADADPGFSATSSYSLLNENRVAMLVSLRKIYKLHGKRAELDEVERRLAELR